MYQFWQRRKKKKSSERKRTETTSLHSTGRKNTHTLTPLIFYVCGCSVGKCLQLPLEARLVAATREAWSWFRAELPPPACCPEKGKDTRETRWATNGAAWVSSQTLAVTWGEKWGDSLRLWLPELVSDIWWCFPSLTPLKWRWEGLNMPQRRNSDSRRPSSWPGGTGFNAT